jgi:TnpA family transposase
LASVERTAYPRFSSAITAAELQHSFTPTEVEQGLAQSYTRTDQHALCFVILLKSFQRLHYFPALEQVPAAIIAHVRTCLQVGPEVVPAYETGRTLYRHHVAIREYLRVKPFEGKQARHVAVEAAYRAAQVMNPQADLINAAIETLIRSRYELPSFWTLNRMVQRVHAVVQRQMVARVSRGLTIEQAEQLDRLLVIEFEQRQTAFNALKRLPRKPSRQHLEELVEHLEWLDSLGDTQTPLAGIAPAKVRDLAYQAKALDAAELKDFAPPRRHALLLCLIHRMRVRTKDSLGEMYVKRMATVHKRAKEELVEIQLGQRQRTERLLEKFGEVVEIAASKVSDLQTGRRVRALLAAAGGIENVQEECASVRLWNGDNYLPLLWKHFVPLRYVVFRMVRALTLESTTQDQALLQALEVVLSHEKKRADSIARENIDLSFASDRWQNLVRDEDEARLNRRQLEMCVFSHLATALQSGDICITGSESFADYRQELLPWEECKAELKDFCHSVGLPETAAGFVKELKTRLTDTAAEADKKYPENADLTISSAGEPVLKRVTAKDIPDSAVTLQAAITQRMPTRNLLDILINIEHWTNFTRHFGPLSGTDPKLDRAAERYLQTVFAIGCNLGPTQAARHMAGTVSAHMLSFVNRRHFTVEKLEAAQRELIELYLLLDLPKVWGDGRTVAADGTQYDFYDENLLAGYHFRYRKMGAVAYRHVANNYIAVFSHFIPPGVWEAVYVIEGLLKGSQLSVQPDTVHSDTQGQSVTVFAFTHLLGINLMPRIRNWKDLHFFRPSRKARYDHIDSLFTATIDWQLIETHWEDLMQVALSIQNGKISSAMLLRKLGNESRQNRLFLAAQEVGRAVRTIFLLEWISSLRLRQEVTGTTNKIESYNGFSKWLSFGGDVIGENDPDEQQKHLRYNDLVATAVILQNTVDMTRIVADLQREGWRVSAADLSFLSPYQTSTVKRFGEYVLNLSRPPEPWIKEVMQLKTSPSQTLVLPLAKEA